MEWKGQAQIGSLTATANQTVQLTLIEASDVSEYTSPTIVRILGTLLVSTNSVLTTGQDVLYSAGLIVTPAVTITPADFLPEDNMERNWMWWTTDRIPWTDYNAQYRRYPLDIVLNRKIGDGQELNFFIYNSTLSSQTLNFSIGIRYLIKD